MGDQVPEDFDAGTDFTVFQLSNNHGKVAPLICFEDTIGELTGNLFFAAQIFLPTSPTTAGFYAQPARVSIWPTPFFDA